MGFVLSSLAKDLKRWRLDRMSVLIWLGIPLLIGGLMTMMVGGDARPRGVLLIADEDESLVSGLVAGAYRQGELGELITVEAVDVETGNARITAGEASAFLTIPEGFGDALLEATPVTLTLKTNPSQTILPGIIRDVTEILLDAGFYAHQLFASELEQIASYDDGNVPDDAAVAAIAVAVQDKLEAAAPHLFPPGFELTIVAPPAAEPSVPVALMFLPGIVVMAVIIAASGLAADYWQERERGTLRRLVCAPGGVAGFLAGKALAAGIVVAGIGGVTLVAGFLYNGVAWNRLPLALLWAAASGVALFAWFGVLHTVAGTRRAANVLSMLILFPLLMAGGSFFPLDVLPDWIAGIGRLTPNGFAADRLTGLLTATDAPGLAAGNWLIVLLMAVSGLAVCAWRLNTGFAQR